jgi:transcription termination factor Rho
MVLEKAKRLVEHKRDVVILLDSITAWPAPTTPSSRHRARC